MNLRTTTRVAAVLGAALALLGTAALVTSPTASALEKDRVVLGEDESVELVYGPLLGANPGANVDASTTISTDICLAAPFCDVVPLTVLEPRTFTMDDADFFVEVTLTWDTLVIPDVPLEGDVAVDDYDLWIVNDPFDEEAGPDEDGFAYRSASLANPESVTMFAPVGDWNILVNNAGGRSLSYTLTFEWVTAPLPTPFESLPPTFSETGTAAPAPTPTVAPSLATPPTSSPVPAPVFDIPAPATPDIGLDAPAVADGAFDEGFDDDGGLADALAAPPTTILDLDPVGDATSFPEPSGLALLLWLLALPLLLTAGVGAYLQRRSSTSIGI